MDEEEEEEGPVRILTFRLLGGGAEFDYATGERRTPWEWEPGRAPWVLQAEMREVRRYLLQLFHNIAEHLHGPASF